MVTHQQIPGPHPEIAFFKYILDVFLFSGGGVIVITHEVVPDQPSDDFARLPGSDLLTKARLGIPDNLFGVQIYLDHPLIRRLVDPAEQGTLESDGTGFPPEVQTTDVSL